MNSSFDITRNGVINKCNSLNLKAIVVIILMMLSLSNAKAGRFDDMDNSAWVADPPTPDKSVWYNDCYMRDEDGQYWERFAEWLAFCPNQGKWEKTDRAVYKSGKSFEETFNKCMEQKITGNETKAGANAIYEICNGKADKARKKTERRVRKWKF